MASCATVSARPNSNQIKLLKASMLGLDTKFASEKSYSILCEISKHVIKHVLVR